MSDAQLPTALFRAMRRDLRPVRPLASPPQRAVALLPIAIVLLIGLPVFWCWFYQLPLAPWLSWGPSILEAAFSLVLLAASFREAVPGRELSARTVTTLALVACVGFLFLNTTLSRDSSASLESLLPWIWRCFSASCAFGIPALIVPAWLVSRALPNRPALTGGLCGLGTGVMANAGLRLFCWEDGSNLHFILAHGGSIIALMLIGALCTSVVERIKAPRR